MADILPGYLFDRRTGRYRDQASGRFTSRQAINDLLDRQIESTERRLANLTTAMHDGRIAPGVWAEQMRTELRRATLQHQALGAGGWDRLTQSDFGKAGASLRDTYARMIDLAQGVQNGTVTLPQALNRVNGYIGEARRLYYDASRGRRQPDMGMIGIEIRDLGVAEHCDGCVDLHGRGWQPVGVLPSPGDGSTPCGTHCRCGMRSREVPADEVGEWLGTRR